MRKLLGVGLVALGLAFSGSAIAADGGALYKAKCAACHGGDGGGTAMAPAFTGNDWVADASNDEVADTIVNGRQGGDKMYKKFAIGMPAQKSLSADEVSALVNHLKDLAAK